MKLPFPGGLRLRIALLILLGALPAFFVVAGLALSQRDQAIAKTYEDTTRLARLASAKEGTLIEGAKQLTIALTLLPAVAQHDIAGCNAFAGKLLAGYPQYTNF